MKKAIILLGDQGTGKTDEAKRRAKDYLYPLFFTPEEFDPVSFIIPFDSIDCIVFDGCPKGFDFTLFYKSIQASDKDYIFTSEHPIQIPTDMMGEEQFNKHFEIINLNKNVAV